MQTCMAVCMVKFEVHVNMSVLLVVYRFSDVGGHGELGFRRGVDIPFPRTA
jgi:hypothetical protein